MSGKLRRRQAQLALRQLAWQSIPVDKRGGFTRPGSLNAHKQGGANGKGKR